MLNTQLKYITGWEQVNQATCWLFMIEQVTSIECKNHPATLLGSILYVINFKPMEGNIITA